MSRSLTELKPNDHNALGYAAFADRYTIEWELAAGLERDVLISYLQSSISNLSGYRRLPHQRLDVFDRARCPGREHR